MADLITSFLVQVKEKDIKLYERIVTFKNLIGIDNVINGRYSLVFLLDIFFGCENNQVNPDAVMREIKWLEGLADHDTTGKTKRATMFRGALLNGLWHKHYYQGSLDQLAQNVNSAMSEYGMPYFQRKILEAEASGEERFVSVEDIPHIVNDIVSGNLSTRRSEGKMTGEWIVYAIHENVNYYLCLSSHNEGDENISERITICQYEFQFLSSFLANKFNSN